MKRNLKLMLLGVVALVIIAAMLLSSLRAVSVAATVVRPTEAHVWFTESGTVSSGADLTLLSTVSGDILSTVASEGDLLQAGDLLVVVDAADYQRELAVLEANIAATEAQMTGTTNGLRDQLTAAHAALTQIEAERKSAEAQRLSVQTVAEQLVVLEMAVERQTADAALSAETLAGQEALFAVGALSKAEIEQARDLHHDVQAALDISLTELEQLRGKVQAGDLAQSGEIELFETRRQQVEQQIAQINRDLANDGGAAYYRALIDAQLLARDALLEKVAQCEIRSPAAGVVTQMPTQGMHTLAQGEVVAVIQRREQMQVECYVATKDIAALQLGGEVELVRQGREEDMMVPGTVASLADWAEARTSALGLDEKRVKVVVRVEPGAPLIPGSDVDVRFTVYRQPDKLLVPTSAVFEWEGSRYVFVVEGGKAVRRAVETGVKTLTQTVIESGLAAEDVVINEADSTEFQEGGRVKGQTVDGT